MPGHKSPKRYGGWSLSTPAYFINTQGNSNLGIGVCSRCNFKFPLTALRPDPNLGNSFLVCAADRDDFDPYRLPMRSPDVIQLPNPRPDVPLTAPEPPDWEPREG